MRDADTRIYNTLIRVRDLGAEHSNNFPAGSRTRALFDQLNSLITELQEHIGQQSAGTRVAKQSATGKAAARDKLRQLLSDINRTARTMALDTPGLEDQFQLPPRNDTALAGAARAFFANATPIKAGFIQNEMPADFLVQLQACLDAFEGADNSKNLSREQHVAATASIADLLERGLKLVKQLDTLILNKFRDDPAMLAAWQSASHVERAPRARTKKPKPAPPA